MTDQRLYRSETDRVLGGVCGGIAEVYDADPTLVRLLTALLIFGSSGTGLLMYIVAWIVMPPEREVKGESGLEKNRDSSDEDPGSADEEGSSQCSKCGREFDSQRGLNSHRDQMH